MNFVATATNSFNDSTPREEQAPTDMEPLRPNIVALQHSPGATVMSRKDQAFAEISAIKELIGDLETRLNRLNSAAKKESAGASDDISEFVSQALKRIGDLVRESAQNATRSVAEEAALVGGDAVKKLRNELEQRPITALAVAAGIGYLFGLIGRRG